VSLTYSLIIAAALAVGFLSARLTQSKLQLSGREKLGICLGAYVGAMLGAKLPFVLSDWNGFVSGVAWFSSGKTILCGLVGGYFGVEVAKWTLDVNLKTGDTFAVPVPLSIAVGRLGCFFAGCCYGTPTELPWGSVFPNVDALPRHPTQLYETVSMVLLIFLLLAFYPFRRHEAGIPHFRVAGARRLAFRIIDDVGPACGQCRAREHGARDPEEKPGEKVAAVFVHAARKSPGTVTRASRFRRASGRERARRPIRRGQPGRSRLPAPRRGGRPRAGWRSPAIPR